MNEDLCGQYGITCAAEAESLKASLLDIAGISELFKALSDETRTRILHLLGRRELCVCDLAFLLDMSLPAVSHHLRFLKALRLVRSRKDGKNVFYSLDDAHVLSLMEQARAHYIERT